MNNYQLRKTFNPRTQSNYIHDVLLHSNALGNQHEQNAKEFIGWMCKDLWEQIPMFLAHVQANEVLFSMQNILAIIQI